MKMESPRAGSAFIKRPEPSSVEDLTRIDLRRTRCRRVHFARVDEVVEKSGQITASG